MSDTDKIRSALWKGILETGRNLPQGELRLERGQGLFTDDGTGLRVMQARYRFAQRDGTERIFDVTVSTQESVGNRDPYWSSMLQNGDASRRVVVNGIHYMLGADDARTPGMEKGYGGRKFVIEYLADGRQVVTHDLMYQGPIPPSWREHFPDNARFIPCEPEYTP